jgi:hypothetical protein
VQKRHHYEAAFEHWLRERRRPYVAVHEARKALVPGPEESLKSFDFVLYGDGLNLLADVKGRRLNGGRLESWATEEDVGSLLAWERLFGDGFAGALVFVYWCEGQPAAPLFEETFEHEGRWYAVRVVLTREYAKVMKPRSPKWRTVHVPGREFDRACVPLGRALSGDAGNQARVPVHSLA